MGKLADSLTRTPETEAQEAEHWEGRWHGLRRWFLGEAGGASQAEILRARAREAMLGPADDGGPLAELVTSDGILRGPDCEVTILYAHEAATVGSLPEETLLEAWNA